MPTDSTPLLSVFDGWDGHETSIVNAVEPLTREQLVWRPDAELRSVGEVIRHLALGRIDWLLRMDAPGIQELAARISTWDQDPHGNKYVIEDAVVGADDAAELLKWLDASGQVIDKTLKTWTVDDLKKTYRHTWRGDTYAVSRQWTTFRIMEHDFHHGGELALMLGMQGISAFELGDLGGHITELPLAEGGD